MAKKNDNEYFEYSIEDILKSLSVLKKEIKQLRQGIIHESKLAYTNQDLMDMFAVGTKTLKKWRDCGELTFTQRGSIYLYSRDDINEFLRRNHFDFLELNKEISNSRGL